MAKTGEDQRDPLFDMNVGDGLIDVNVEEKPAVETAEEKAKIEKKPEVGEPSIYEDGTFEIDDTPSENTDAASAEEQQEFIDKTDNKETEDKKTPSKTPSDSSSSSPYLAFAQDRAKEGVFLDFNEGDWKTLVERNEGDEAAALKELSVISMQEMVNTGVENYKNSITPEERTLYEAKEKGLPLDDYSIAKRNFDKYSKIKEDDLSDNEKLQIDVVSKFLELRGYSSEEITEEIEGYKALENLEVKAKKALKGVPGTFKKRVDDIEAGAQSQEQARQDGIRQRVAKMKRNIESTPEIIPGIKLTKPTRDKIFKSMTIPIAKDDQGNPLNPVMATRARNPEGFEMMIHYYHQLGLFNIDDDGQIKPDFSKISKTAKTKATDEFRSAFETRDKPMTGKVVVPTVNEDDLDEFEKAFRRI